MFSLCLTPARNDTFASMWSYVLSHWTPDKVYVLGSNPEDYSTRFFKDAELVQTAEMLPDAPLVLLASKLGRYVTGTVELADFTHPKEVTYLFGPDNAYMSEDYLGSRQPDHHVYIETDTKDDLYSFVAAAIVLRDRRLRHG